MQIVAHHNRYSDAKELVVTCEQTMFIITHKGQIRFQRRLEFTPSCLLTYHLGKHGADIYEDEERSKEDVERLVATRKPLETPCFMTILGSFNNFLMVYKDIRLVWAAKTQLAPVFVQRATFE